MYVVRPLHRSLPSPASSPLLDQLMARRLVWSDVRGGLLALLVLVAISVATLKYARVGALHGDRIRLYARAGEARGILKGSEVWLLGQKVGLVTDIRFLSPSESDTDEPAARRDGGAGAIPGRDSPGRGRADPRRAAR